MKPNDNTEANLDAIKTILNGLHQSDQNVYEEEQLNFIEKILDNQIIKDLIKVHEKLLSTKEHTTKKNCIELCKEILRCLEENASDEKCTELAKIIKSPYFRCLIEAHDNIVYETYKVLPMLPPEETSQKSLDGGGPPIRVVGLSVNPKKPLGITLAKHPDNCIYIQRILLGTMVEKQGLLNVGDVLQEINGAKVGEDPLEVQKQLNSADGDLTLKVIPAFKDSRGICQVHLRCHFDYNPSKDSLFPKSEIGLAFQCGDILEVKDQSEPDWWQATHYNDNTNTGLVPSLQFEHRRKASSTKKVDEHKSGGAFKKKKKFIYRTSENKILDFLDTKLYEEVTRMPPMERKVIVLIGAQGIGRRTLKNRLIASYPDRYADVTRDTSRSPREGEVSGRGYIFRQPEEMKADVLSGKYLEWGENGGVYYGTRLNEIRDIINSGKTCVIDTDPSALKLLHTAEFMPLIVFIDAPKLEVLMKNNQKGGDHKPPSAGEMKEIIRESSSISENYHHYFDMRITNDDFDKTYDTLREHIEISSSESQWVPVHWVY